MRYENSVGQLLATVPLEDLMEFNELTGLIKQVRQDKSLYTVSRSYLYSSYGYQLDSFILAKGNKSHLAAVDKVELALKEVDLLLDTTIKERGLGLVQSACNVPGVNKLQLDYLAHKVILVVSGGMLFRSATGETLLVNKGDAAAVDNVTKKTVDIAEDTLGIIWSFVPNHVDKPIWDLYDPY